MNAQHKAAWITLLALDQISLPPRHRTFVVDTKFGGGAGLSARNVMQIEVLAWSYRRALPPHLAPKLPPRDPVVLGLKQEAANG